MDYIKGVINSIHHTPYPQGLKRIKMTSKSVRIYHKVSIDVYHSSIISGTSNRNNSVRQTPFFCKRSYLQRRPRSRRHLPTFRPPKPPLPTTHRRSVPATPLFRHRFPRDTSIQCLSASSSNLGKDWQKTKTSTYEIKVLWLEFGACYYRTCTRVEDAW